MRYAYNFENDKLFSGSGMRVPEASKLENDRLVEARKKREEERRGKGEERRGKEEVVRGKGEVRSGKEEVRKVAGEERKGDKVDVKKKRREEGIRTMTEKKYRYDEHDYR